jgi:cytochrome c553
MTTVLKGAGMALAALLLLFAAMVCVAIAITELVVRWPAPTAVSRLQDTRDPDAVLRGRTVAEVNGCHGCHGGEFEGRFFVNRPMLLRASGPNLTGLVRNATASELDRAIRHGVGADGRRLWVMPSNAYANLTDQETADLIAYMRSFPPREGAPRTLAFGPLARVGILTGRLKSEPAAIADNRGVTPLDLGPAHAQGRAMSRACVECHGPELKGHSLLGAPDLSVAGAYQAEEFERLLRHGEGPGGRRLTYMSKVGPRRFASWSQDDIGRLHAYLAARAAHQARLAEGGAR